MSVQIDPQVVEACKRRGIGGPTAFQRRYGVRVQDISPERALALLNPPKPPYDPNFPDRWRAALDADHTRQQAKDELKDFRNWQIEAIRRAWYEEDAKNDHRSYATDYQPAGLNDADSGEQPAHPRRLTFGILPGD